MKKRFTKLSLNRETLRRLGSLSLQYVQGAATTTGPHEVSEVYSACPLDCDTGPVYTGPFYATCPGYSDSCSIDYC